MNKVAVSQKLNRMEVEIKFLKKAVNQRSDFDSEEKIWQKIKPALKKARAQVAKEVYG